MTQAAHKEPSLSIIIININTRDWLKGCLDSLARQDLFEKIQVVVVEHASTDGSADMLAADYPWATVVPLSTNAGFGESNNAGAKVCTAPWLVILNSDTVVHDGALTDFFQVLSEHPECTLAGGLIYDGDGTLERSTGSFPTFASLALNTGLGWVAFLRRALGQRALQHWTGYDRTRTVDWLTGAYIWIRRDLFEAIGGFDENIFMYCDDIDLCYRAKQAGHAAWFFPRGSITHYRNKTPVPRSRKEMQRESQCYFAGRHYRSPRYWVTRLTFWALAKL